MELSQRISELIGEGRQLKDERDQAVVGLQVQAKEIEKLKFESEKLRKAVEKFGQDPVSALATGGQNPVSGLATGGQDPVSALATGGNGKPEDDPNEKTFSDWGNTFDSAVKQMAKEKQELQAQIDMMVLKHNADMTKIQQSADAWSKERLDLQGQISKLRELQQGLSKEANEALKASIDKRYNVMAAQLEEFRKESDQVTQAYAERDNLRHQMSSLAVEAGQNASHYETDAEQWSKEKKELETKLSGIDEQYKKQKNEMLSQIKKLEGDSDMFRHGLDEEKKSSS